MSFGPVTLGHYLSLGGLLFALSVIGIYLNRRNLIVLLMAIELMLLAVNMNFVAFAHYLGDMAGQVFVFFILMVAAAEPAKLEKAIQSTGLFRNKAKSIHGAAAAIVEKHSGKVPRSSALIRMPSVGPCAHWLCPLIQQFMHASFATKRR